ncbi:hypothetical protein HYR99_12590 [Candidatus Poribacteria bacterium]|nr:hypothetical protein [Candidatus Poribacteria bacterium]
MNTTDDTEQNRVSIHSVDGKSDRQIVNITLREAVSISGTLLMLDGVTPHVAVVVQAVLPTPLALIRIKLSERSVQTPIDRGRLCIPTRERGNETDRRSAWYRDSRSDGLRRLNLMRMGR